MSELTWRLRRALDAALKSIYIHALWVYSTLLGRTAVVLLLTLFFIVMTSAFMFYHLENTNFFTAIYWAIITITTVGYGDVVPQSFQGRLLAMAVAISGFAGLTAALSMATHAIMEKAIKEKEGELKVKGTRIMIVGSSPACALIAVQLIADVGKRGRIVWVTSYDTPEKYVARARESGVVIVRGSLTEVDTYVRGGIETAREVIICGRNDKEGLSSLVVLRTLSGKSIYPPKIIFIAYNKRAERIATQEFGVDVVISMRSIGHLFKESLADPTAAMFLSALSEEHPKLVEIIIHRYAKITVAKMGHRIYLLGRREYMTANEVSEAISRKRKKQVYVVAKVVGLDNVEPLRPGDYVGPNDILVAVEFDST
ncbi:MAG: hypothetical protein GXO07_04220 [Crenarchaeota archaeon]|nr:hypothetical protein [Thermoproteota archaeon]